MYRYRGSLPEYVFVAIPAACPTQDELSISFLHVVLGENLLLCVGKLFDFADLVGTEDGCAVVAQTPPSYRDGQRLIMKDLRTYAQTRRRTQTVTHVCVLCVCVLCVCVLCVRVCVCIATTHHISD